MSKKSPLSGEEPIKIDELEHDFKDEIALEPGGEHIRRCFACGTCSVICPVFAVQQQYDPRKIIRMVILGMREGVLKSDLIWLCAGCYNCYELCPRDVKITTVMGALRNIAVRDGHIPKALGASVDQLEKFGRLLEVSDFENIMRMKKNIPELKVELPEVRELLAKCGIREILKGGNADG